MRRTAAILAMFGASACASAEKAEPDAPRADARTSADGPAGPDAEEEPDAMPGAPDASPDAAPPSMGTLLLTEVCLAPSTGELIEIANPTASTVDLSNYWVTDVPTYFRLPAGTQTIDTSDFIARFPAGATIAPGAVITIAVDTASNFQLQYGAPPTYTLVSGTMTVTGVGTLNLTNTGEPVVLFYWDGASDLVADVDLMIAGAPTVGNALANKSAIAVDGPDADSTPSAYANDVRTIANTPTPGSAQSIKRIMLETGHELQNGDGNGYTGDDETSETTSTTWDTTFSAPTPGTTPL